MSGRKRNEPDALRARLIADLFSSPIWHRDGESIVSPPWRTLTVEARDLIADALKQWKPPA